MLPNVKLSSFLFPPQNVQISKKEKPELLKTVTITPSENTHFRVILSSEAMEPDIEAEVKGPEPVCKIVKPEPRTPVTPVTPISSLTPSDCMTTSTPTEPHNGASNLQGGVTGDACPKTDSPSKKKGT